MRIIDRPLAVSKNCRFAVLMPNPAILLARKLLIGLGFEETSLESIEKNHGYRLIVFSAEARDYWIHEWKQGTIFCHLQHRYTEKNMAEKLKDQFRFRAEIDCDEGNPIGMNALCHLAALTALTGIFPLLGDPNSHTIRIDFEDVKDFAHSLSNSVNLDLPDSWTIGKFLANPLTSLYRTRDGNKIYLHLGVAAHFQRFLTGIGRHCQDDESAVAAAVGDIQDPLNLPNPRVAKKLRRTLEAIFLRNNLQFWLRFAQKWKIILVAAENHDKHDSLSLPHASVETREFAQITTQGSDPIIADMQFLPGKALHGLRVLDLGQIIAAPFIGRSFAEFGADVIHIAPSQATETFRKPLHYLFNCGKRSFFLNLRNENDFAELKSLIAEWKPHVIIHNLLPSAASNLGICEASWRKGYPPCSIIQICPNSLKPDLPAFEQSIQAETGLMQSYGGMQPRLLAIPFGDFSAGLMAFCIFLGEYLGREELNQVAMVKVPLDLSPRFLLAGSEDFSYAWRQFSKEKRPDWRGNATPVRNRDFRICENGAITTHGLPIEIDGMALNPLSDAQTYSRESHQNDSPTTKIETNKHALRRFLRKRSVLLTNSPWIAHWLAVVAKREFAEFAHQMRLHSLRTVFFEGATAAHRQCESVVNMLLSKRK